MPVSLRQVWSEQHVQIGSLIQRDARILLERWSRRAVEEQPNACRLHHEVLLDHLPVFLREMGRSLMEADYRSDGWHCPPAREHGEQRWEAGWSLEELVRDYLLLRLVILEHIEEVLERPLLGREVMAVGVALDEAIAVSTSTFARHQAEWVRQAERERAEREKRADEERHQQQAAALREAERRKDEFLAVLGHELRNPLAPLSNALHVLHLRGSDPATVVWAQEVAERQVRHLTRLVDDLMDVSRIGRGKILLRRERIDLRQLVHSIVEDYRRSFEDGHLRLTLEESPNPLWVVGDPVRLAQVIGNLLNNAAKFTDPGGSVTVSVARDEGVPLSAVVRVRDTGIGIDPATLPRVFEMFTQAERTMGRTRGGLGLGLALVKGLVELHGGEVQTMSAGAGQGAEFSFRLPEAQQAGLLESTPRGLPPRKEPLRILLVEDDRDNVETLRVLLELAGHQVVVAHTGIGGLEAAQQFRPDAILCDLGLPGMDGLAVARALRENSSTASARLIAMTGYGSEADQQRSREAGFDHHVTKPVNPEQLYQILKLDRPAHAPGGEPGG